MKQQLMNANFVSSFLHLDLNDDGVEDDILCLLHSMQSCEQLLTIGVVVRMSILDTKG